ncbi:hypothetical protein Ahy_A02g007466 [Arachis hypogaea]|uniref:Uncharacterized protein n=1 Tax=Arachis hypogaea TaxID=3818 RepID=A0A445EC82_ARAHY|nr:hypothetical protein Ahy_A02g007466 [Arachis hypogaea]
MEHMLILDVGENKFSSSILSSIVDTLSSLQILRMRQNMLNDIINLSENKLFRTIPEGITLLTSLHHY